MSITVKYALIGSSVLCLFSSVMAESVCKLSGIVTDSSTGAGIAGVSILTTTESSPVLTDDRGNFKIVILAAQPFTVSATKAGYQTFSRLIESTNKDVNLTIALTPSTLIAIEEPTIIPRSSISGRVKGIQPDVVSMYKMVVYVLTNQWYIHPFAANEEGKGYANINRDGTWHIQTVWRGNQAYRIAFLLLERSTYSPPTIPVTSAEPDEAILSQINSVANLIMEAPKGL